MIAYLAAVVCAALHFARIAALSRDWLAAAVLLWVALAALMLAVVLLFIWFVYFSGAAR